MTRAERACEAMPTWMLRRVYSLSPVASYRMAAWLELWRREVADDVLAATDEQSGPWPCAMPRGMH